MSSDSTLAADTAPFTKVLSARLTLHQRQLGRDKRNKQRREDQIEQFRAFLEQHTTAGLALPACSRDENSRVSVETLLIASGLPYELHRRCPEIRQIAETYGKKVGRVRPAEFLKMLPIPPPTVSSSAYALTYGDLLALEAEALSIGERSLAQYRSALNRFMVTQQKTEADQIGDELAGGYEQARHQLIQQLFQNDANLAKPLMSCMNKYREVVAKQQRADSLPDTLAGALTRLVEKDTKKRTPRQLSEAIGQNVRLVADLMAGRRRAAAPGDLSQLETLLGVKSGTLVHRASHYNPRRNNHFLKKTLFPPELQGPEHEHHRTQVRRLLNDDFPSLPPEKQDENLNEAIRRWQAKEHLTEYGRRSSESVKSPYVMIEAKTPPRLQQEFSELTNMKITRGSMGRLKPREIKKAKWRPGTVGIWDESMRMFLGWCVLPRTAVDPMQQGAGLSPDDLTLGLILLPELIDGYMEFRSIRADGDQTRTTGMFLDGCLGMLKAGSGWVESGSSKLLDRMPEEFQQNILKGNSTWQEKCQEQRGLLIELRDDLIANIKPGRDSFVPINALIETGRPMDYVHQALDGHWNELQDAIKQKRGSKREQAEMFRDHVLISMLASLPLRASHWSGMTYRRNVQTLLSAEKSELRYVNGQDWALRLRAADFKNSRNTMYFGPNGDEDLAMLFREAPNGLADLEPLVDEYMRVYRPLLCAGDGPVFPTSLGTALNRYQLYQIVRRWTTKYLTLDGDRRYGLCMPGVRPVGPHAFRHLTATHILKTGGSVEDAACLLLDNISTVLQHYGKFRKDEKMVMAWRRMDVTRAVRKGL